MTYWLSALTYGLIMAGGGAGVGIALHWIRKGDHEDSAR